MIYFNKMPRVKNIHFIGLGGAGMSGIAEVLINQGYRVTGSDKCESQVLHRLRFLGAKTFVGHDKSNIIGADVVVVSSAIAQNNPELVAAYETRIPILPRAQMLAELMRFHYSIAVSGTHGKTTTTSLIASILAEGGADPTFVIGGLLNSAGSNAKLGKSRYFVVEADESDLSFLRLQPVIAIVTNIDADHMQAYNNDFSKLKKAFCDFLYNLPFYGLAVLCIDNETVKELLPYIARPIVTYGFDKDSDIRAEGWRQTGMSCRYEAHFKNDASSLEVELNLPGKHNVLNSLAAIAVACECGINKEAILSSFKKFKGVERRLQFYGNLRLSKGSAVVIDDYGHHPCEITASLEAIRAAWPNRRLVLAFQPHRYSRTQLLLDEFAAALSSVDLLLLMEIYSAGEQPIAGVSSTVLMTAIRKRSGLEPIFAKDNSDLIKIVKDVLRDGDIMLLQGAGNIGVVAGELMRNNEH